MFVQSDGEYHNQVQNNKSIKRKQKGGGGGDGARVPRGRLMIIGERIRGDL